MITVVGAGNIGSAIVDFLLEKDNISVIDISEKSLKKLTNVKKYKGTVMDNKQVIEKSDFVINALPGSISFEIISKIIKMGKGVIDVSYMPEDPFLLNDIAMEKNVFFVPDAGFAPGLSNIAAGFLYKSLISPKKIEIYVAGLPMIKVPPLDYTITWSIEGLIDEYTRPARMIKNYKIVSVDPLETVEPFCISNLGSYESFVSDGLRTLLKTIKIRDMFERTLRYPSHIDKIKMLRDLGYFSKEKIGNCSPYEITVSLFKKLKLNVEDVCIMLVKGIGKNTGEIFLYDKYDHEKGLSSMARVTGYTAGAIATVLQNVDFKGVIPPEIFGFENRYFNSIKNVLKEKGIILNVNIQ